MKEFLAFVRKEFYHIFRDRRTMLILLVMPIVLIILFGFALSTEVRNIKKPAGAKPGMVVYEVYTTVYVTPRPGLEEQLRQK